MTYTTIAPNVHLDLPAYRGQRVEHFTYQLINGVTNTPIRWLHPDKRQVPALAHNTDQSIKRRLTLTLGVTDTAAINPITDRILPSMIVGGVTYPLGRYMFTDDTSARSTGGDRGTFTLLDEGFIIDQPLSKAFTAYTSPALKTPANVVFAVTALLTQVNATLLGASIAPSPYPGGGSWSAGQMRGQILESYATQGDYFPYWMRNDGFFSMIRTIDPALAVADFDFDEGFKVKRDTIMFTNDVLSAPNRFIVISNSSEAQKEPVVGTYDIPPSAPHSIQNRGFVIANTSNIQIASPGQAFAAARNLGIRNTVYERVTCQTALDPRHDSYNIIRFQDDNWLELSWSMNLVAGGAMTHTMRKAYL